MAVYNTSEAQARLLELMNAAVNGEEIVIARRGKPVAKLIPVEATNITRSAMIGTSDEKTFTSHDASDSEHRKTVSQKGNVASN